MSWICFGAVLYVKNPPYEEDGNGRVLDTGLRGDPPALEVLDGLLEANEFLLGSGEAQPAS